MNGESFEYPLTVCVMDIETAPDPAALALAPRGGKGLRAGLDRITAIGMLTAKADETLGWEGLSLRTFGDEAEFDLLMALDDHLEQLDEGALLVTFNGLRHDVGVIRRRLARHFMFSLPGIRWVEAAQHRDLMRSMTRGWRDAFPTLRDACAGLGIPTDHLLAAPGGGGRPLPMRKVEVDVCATFLLLLYEMALERRDGDILVNGWRALDHIVSRCRTGEPHLEQFRHIPTLRAAARLQSAEGASHP